MLHLREVSEGETLLRRHELCYLAKCELGCAKTLGAVAGDSQLWLLYIRLSLLPRKSRPGRQSTPPSSSIKLRDKGNGADDDSGWSCVGLRSCAVEP